VTELLRRLRVPVSVLGGAALVLGLKPAAPCAFCGGLVAMLGGEALRLWAAAHIRKDKALAATGPYAMVRNPLYLGSALLAGGACLALTDPARPLRSLALWAAVSLLFSWFYAPTIRSEEAHLARLFGPGFERYASRVPALLPDPRLLGEAVRTSRADWASLRRNRELTTLAAVVALAVWWGHRLMGEG